MSNLIKIITTIFIIFSFSFHLQAQNELEVTDLITSPEGKKKLDKAHKILNVVKMTKSFIKNLKDLKKKGVICPVGIGDETYAILIDQIKLSKNNTATTNVYFAYTFKKDNTKIAFHGNELPFKPNGGFGGDASLELAAPFKIKLNNDIAIKFKMGTKLTYNCNGFKNVDAKIELIFSNKFIAVDKQYKPIQNQNVTISADISFTNFEDFLVQLDINKSFMIKGIKDIVFNLKKTIVDMSDERTPEISFPQNYESSDFLEGNKNQWKGLYVKSASIVLPKQLHKKNTKTSKKEENKRLIIMANNLIIDRYGLTTDIQVNNIMDRTNLDSLKWDLTFENTRLKIFKNKVEEFYFDGGINAPPLKKNSKLDYTANFNFENNKYLFNAKLNKELPIDFLYSKIKIDNTSRIEISASDNNFDPSLHLNGKITIDAPIKGGKKFSIPDLTFKNMYMGSKAPYFKMGDIGIATSGNIGYAGFPISINNIKSTEKIENREKISGLKFDVDLELFANYSGSTTIALWGNTNNWKFHSLDIQKVGVNINIPKAMSLNGEVTFLNGDLTYGNGFRGKLSLELIDQLKVDAVASFGKVNNYNYFLVDAFTSVKIPLSFITINGLGGGAYLHMRQQNSKDKVSTELGKTLTGINYVPDKNIGMGFMARTKLGITNADMLLDASANFEIQFNKNWGVNYVRFFGDAKILPPNLDNSMKSLKSTLESTNFSKAKLITEQEVKSTVPKSDAPIYSTFYMNYDGQNRIFNAEMESFVNIGNGLVKGVNEEGSAGKCQFYFSDSDWFMKFGEPKRPLGLNFLNMAKTGSYFMTGSDIPDIPNPPNKVLSILNSKYTPSRNLATLKSGKGIAFGSKFEMEEDFNLGVFYAKFGLGIGFDFMVKDYGRNAFCDGREGTIGINGWYAQGQAWAWVEGDIGIRCRVFGSKYERSILAISAASLLQAKGPNPFWLKGQVGGRYRIFGGLVKGNCKFSFEIGEQCKVVKTKVFEESIIADATPTDGESEVDVFNSPQAVFNYPINTEIELNNQSYRIFLNKFELTDSNHNKIDGDITWNHDNTVAVFNSIEAFPNKKEIKMYVEVCFEKKEMGKWIKVKDREGNINVEYKELIFKSGLRPTEIDKQCIAYSYPIDKQLNFHKNEYQECYIKLDRNYSYLFEPSDEYTQKAAFFTFDHKELFTDIQYDKNQYIIKFKVPKFKKEGGLINNKIYKLRLMNIPKSADKNLDSNIKNEVKNLETAEGNTTEVTTKKAEGSITNLKTSTLLTLNFRTSHYATFQEKFDQCKINCSGKLQIFYGVDYFQSQIIIKEQFDKFEINSTSNALVQIEANLDNTKFYNDNFKELTYNKYIKNKYKITWRGNTEDVGIPPIKSTKLLADFSQNELSEQEITNNKANTIPNFRINYNTMLYLHNDFYDIKNKVANELVKDIKNKYTEKIITTKELPFLPKGNYPLKIKYTLPGLNKTTSIINLTLYNKF